MRQKKDNPNVIFYTDEQHDDFANTNFNTITVDKDFNFVPQNIFWRAASFLLYYIIALPIIFLLSKLLLGLKIKNRSAVKKLKGKSCFIYANHTMFLDAFLPALVSAPKRAQIVAGPDAVSIKGIKNIVMMLGCIPIPTNRDGLRPFMHAIDTYLDKGRTIAVFPEAHIWPYCTFVRSFPSTSFRYPVSNNTPVIAMCSTFRKRKGIFSFCRRPGVTLYVSEPFYPDESLSPRDAREKLKNEVYGWMKKTAEEKNSYEYIKYVKKDNG